MKETNKHLNLLIFFTENLYKIMKSIKLNMTVCVIFLLSMLMKTKTNFFKNINIKMKLNFFSHIKLKFQPRT